MTILVTGGAGYIGSHMILALVDRGCAPLVVDDLSTGFAWAVPDKATMIIADAGDEETMTALMREHKVKTLMHFAAKVIVAESIIDPLGYYMANTVNTRNIISSCVRAGVKNVILSSTAAVYGNPVSVAPIHESALIQPMSPYGTSKIMSEIILQDSARAHDLRYVVLRYFNVAGADPDCRSGQSSMQATHLIKIAMEAAVGIRKEVEIFGTDYNTKDGTCIRDYIHVMDLVDAHICALNYIDNGGENIILNCGYGHGFSVMDVLKTVVEISGKQFLIRRVGRRPGDPEKIVADSTALRSRLGWTPRYNDLATIIAHSLAWERVLPTRRQKKG